MARQIQMEPVRAEAPGLGRGEVGRGDDQQASGTQQRASAGEVGARVGHVLERMLEYHRVETVADLAGRGGERPALAGHPARRGLCASVGGGLETRHLPASLGEHHPEVAAAAANVEEAAGRASVSGRRGSRRSAFQ